ncbi:hypothetical protein EV193_110203 [Herbihabitans rhizosphaerae]|uniref:Pentapeptide repeat protein n=2 Tax=Herbihabitans rhizosphaerae TaxID=1872711 RepID=A0A4Q7KFP9_9PSEU|nr:hypothetical protein EV193_110203 [Herbihabitans rhizosphaerae]
MALLFGGVALLSAIVIVVLWWAGTSGLSGQALVTARFDALKIGLSIAVGGGGVIALYLAWRRQHSTEIGLRLQERTALNTEVDAEQRRITELYTAAVEQLGSDKAPVRLGGLYALERLAQNNPDQRQTIVNVICAYLRMPFAIPGENAPDEQRQEREVRVTAQRILVTHLRPDEANYWGTLDLDLTGAVLTSFALKGARVGTVQCSHATFAEAAAFEQTTFTGNASFHSAMFAYSAWFEDATFEAHAYFTSATFGNNTSFKDAIFARGAFFVGTQFTGQGKIRSFKNTRFAISPQGLDDAVHWLKDG